jgi:hypothetical protein
MEFIPIIAYYMVALATLVILVVGAALRLVTLEKGRREFLRRSVLAIAVWALSTGLTMWVNLQHVFSIIRTRAENRGSSMAGILALVAINAAYSLAATWLCYWLHRDAGRSKDGVVAQRN